MKKEENGQNSSFSGSLGFDFIKRKSRLEIEKEALKKSMENETEKALKTLNSN